MDSIRWLQSWYQAQCNGDWEHTLGVVIETLDNPGWMVRIDLRGTQLETKPFQRIEQKIENGGWLDCRVVNKSFIGAGGHGSLLRICDVFMDWADSREGPSV